MSPTNCWQWPGGTASAAWKITVSVSPRELTVSTGQPSTITIQVVRADNEQPPETGTTLVASTSLGDFISPGSGIQSVALATAGGFATVQLFPGNVVGTAFVVAQLEASVGRAALPVLEEVVPVEASFLFENSQDNLSVQFLNTSEGNPTKFRWDFGDGEKSSEENPSHLYALPGDYPVKLTVSKPGSEDSASAIVTVNDDLEASFLADTSNGLKVVFQDTSEGNPSSWRWNFGDGATSSEQHPTHSYRTDGSYVVSLVVRKGGRTSEASETITVSDNGDDLFVTDIDPEFGPSKGGTSVTISGFGFKSPLRVFFDDLLAEPVSVSGTRIVVRTPPIILEEETCDDDNDGIEGARWIEKAVDVKVELQLGADETVSGGFTYTADTSCRGD